MTDVLILHRIPGAKPGDILPLDNRLQKHIDAGNAKIIPDGHSGWKDTQPETAPVVALNAWSTGTADDEEPESDADADTEDLGGEEDA